MKNLVEAIEPIVARNWKTLRQEACALSLPPPLELAPALPEPDVLNPVLEWRPFSDKQEYAPIHEAHLAAKQEQFEQVMRWYEGQIPISTIAHSLRLSKRTVQRWLATGSAR